MSKFPTAGVSFEQYAAWAASRFPGYREPEVEELASATTVAPVSSEACPVTVKSNQDGYVVVTPRVKRSA